MNKGVTTVNNVSNTHGFDMFVNVDIQLIETDTQTVKKHVTKHNKATRNMIKGILRFLEGRFNATYSNSDPEYDFDAKNYIPGYVSFGDGGITYNEQGSPQEIPDTGTDHVPVLPNNWDDPVDYKTNELIREFTNLSLQRSKVRKQVDTLELVPAGDMDTLVLYSETAPGEVNFDIVDEQGESAPRYVTEVGLFSNFTKSDNDLLAYVKLGNYRDPDNPDKWKTKALYVRPGDTIIITWYITIVALSDISVVDSSEELVEPLIGELELVTENSSNTEAEE